MRTSKASGFTLGEALISVAILGIIAVASFFSLRTSRMNDELRYGIRVVEGDLRSLQVRALNAQNLKFCTDTSSNIIVCEDSAATCSSACTAVPPAGVGMHLAKDATSYVLFAKYDPNTSDWRQNGAGEVFLTRVLAASGAQNVKISALQSGVTTYNSIDIAFQRQNGSMRIDACLVGCTNANTLIITLQHTQSNNTAVITLNTITGRISIEQ